MIQLYSAATGNGRRATIMIEECALPYSYHPIAVGKGAAKPAEFLKINPRGTVPMIVDPDGPGGQTVQLQQSAAILLYLAEKSGKLLPRDPARRPAVLEWMMFAVTDVVGANSAMYYTTLEFAEGGAPQAAYFGRQLLGFLQVCEARLAESAYLAGPEITIADIALFPVFVSRRSLVDAAGGLDNFKRWAARIGARPAVQRALAAGT